ncbi:MAG: hypothetical protein LC130_14070 [Bryobacterales bacterium]|nr:hypothetical protein [Bryobacterales bacterium]
MRVQSPIGYISFLLGLASLTAAATGTLGGTVAVVTPDRQFGGAVPGAVVELDRAGTRIKLTADENGDFIISLSPGDYHLVRVLNAESQELKLHARQARGFTVRKRKHTRFDVMISPEADGNAPRCRGVAIPATPEVSWLRTLVLPST